MNIVICSTEQLKDKTVLHLNCPDLFCLRSEIRDATKMRDTLTVFFRHWLSSLVNKQFPKEYKLVPETFKNGVYNETF